MNDKDYTKEPIGIREAYAERDNDARKWTPRDALINVLRSIDDGLCDLQAIVIIGLHEPCEHDAPNSSGRVSYVAASPSIYTTLGVVDMCKSLMRDDAREGREG